MSSSLSFSKFQSEYREIIRKNPNVTFEELLSGEDSIVCKILNFFDIDIDPKDVTYRQFKYLMWVITKNYVFTSIEDSNNINAMTPFFFV